MKWYQKAMIWINDHPVVKGCLVAAESSGYAALMTVATEPNFLWNKDGIKHAAITVITAVIVGVRMYLKQSTRKEWTPEERQQKLNGGSK